MSGEFTKPTAGLTAAQLGKIVDPDVWNQNLAAIAKASVQGFDVDGLYDDFDVGDETTGSTGALVNDIKIRSGGALKIYNSSGTLITTVTLNEVGQVSPFAMSSVPTGWLECDGSAISRSTYSDLFSAIGTTWGVGDGSTTFNIPDLRGEFIRGWDNGKGTDSGRSFASYQADSFAAHTHYMAGSSGTQPASFTSSAGPNTGGANPTGSTGGSETRPRNYALMYCIKY